MRTLAGVTDRFVVLFVVTFHECIHKTCQISHFKCAVYFFSRAQKQETQSAQQQKKVLPHLQYSFFHCSQQYFKYILLIMLLQLSHFFSPLFPSARYPPPSNIRECKIGIHRLKKTHIAAFTHIIKPLHVSFTISLSSDPFHSRWSSLNPPSPLLGYSPVLPSIQHAGGCQNNLDKGHLQSYDCYYHEPSLGNLYIYTHV